MRKRKTLADVPVRAIWGAFMRRAILKTLVEIFEGDDRTNAWKFFTAAQERNAPPPFRIPPFDGAIRPRSSGEHRFTWWSWHPNYPRWSQSCWGGDTEAEAWAEMRSPMASSLANYHNKLIREDVTGNVVTLTEVADVPCENLELWWRIRAIAERRASSP